MNDKHQGWIASLNNGETYFEGAPQPGQLTPWQQFLLYLEKEGLTVTALRLQKGGKTVHTLGQKSCDGYYQASEIIRVAYRDVVIQKQGIGSVIGDTVYITWLDENGNVWQDVRPLSNELIHTTLRYSHDRNRPDTERTARDKIHADELGADNSWD